MNLIPDPAPPEGEGFPDTAALLAPLGALLQGWAVRGGALLSVRDADSGAWLEVNAAMAAWLGRPAAELLGRTETVLDEALPATLRAAEQQALRMEPGDAPMASEHRFEWRGARHDFQVWRQVALSDRGRRVLCSLWLDQAARRREQEQLRQALHQLEQLQQLNDDLRRATQDRNPREAATGLYQRSFFEDQLRRELDLSAREQRDFALAWLQIDPPAPDDPRPDAAVNERVQAALGRLLRSNTRVMDAACHLGDDRFAVLLSGVGLAVGYGRMEQLRRQCATHIVVHEGREFGFTVSLGVASFPHSERDADALAAACERALALARERGGNQAVLAAVPFQSPLAG